MTTEKDEDGFTADERAFLETGEASDQLVEQNKAPPPAEEPAPAPAAEAAEPADAEDEIDDKPVKGEESSAAAQADRRRRVSRKEFESERQARLAAEKQFNDQRVEAAKVAERLALLQQALQTPEQPAAEPAAPDPEQDIFGYVRHLEAQLKAVTTDVNGYKEQIATGQREMEGERRYFESLNTFAGTKPDFVQAYNYLLRSRAAELVAQSYAATPEQLQGIVDGKLRIPKDVADSLRNEERMLYRTAFERGADPANVIYSYASMRGYKTPAAPAAPAGAPGTALGTTPPAGKPALPTATDVVAQIQKGQAASASLSKTGGSVADTELTPEALANMSDAQFQRLYDELSNSENKEKLMALFGH